MSEDKKKGLGAARDLLPILLENKIREALLSLPKDKSLYDKYPNKENRRKVYRRLILKTIIDEVFKNMLIKVDDNSDIIAIEIPETPSQWDLISSQATAARRDFIHDIDLLNVGKDAELILSPIDQDLTPEDNYLTNDQKLLMMSLFVIRNRPKGVKLKQRTLRVEKHTGIPYGTLKFMNTKLTPCIKKFKKQPSDIEHFTTSQINYWFDLEMIANPSGKSSSAEITAEGGLFPILKGFSEASPYKGRKR
jgi:hypothetical protein